MRALSFASAVLIVAGARAASSHDELSPLMLSRGGEGELGWRFTRSGEVYFACLVPGHLEAGMIGTITVTP
jgi:uncharacterized cupredoxin-like copper-binding protein